MTDDMRLKYVINDVFPKALLRKIFPYTYNSEQPFVNNGYGVYGQHGDDLIIDALTKSKNTGFYIDVGANDPTSLSNTKRFYDRGWNGINIEPNPIKCEKLSVERKRDINLNIGIAPEKGMLDFWVFEPDTCSTFFEDTAKRQQRSSIHLLKDKVKIPVDTLTNVIEEYTKNQHIDFLSIDVEGFEIEVINSNDWSLYRPDLVVVEINQNGKSKIELMESYNYELVFGNGLNGFFINKELIK